MIVFFSYDRGNNHIYTYFCTFSVNARLKTMNNYKSYAFFKHQVVILLIIYLFFALTNIFFIPHYTSAIANETMHSGFRLRRQSLETKNDAVSFNIITDKSILDDDLLNSPKAVAILLLVFGGLGFFSIKARTISPNSKIYYNLRYSFLFFCKLRI
jgi:hypothetical protein